MRDPSKKHTLTAPSIEEIHWGVVHSVTPRLGRTLTFRGKKLPPAAVINAVMLHFLGLDAERQRAIVAHSLARYEEMLACDEVQEVPRSLAGDDDAGWRSQTNALPPEGLANGEKPPAGDGGRRPKGRR